MQHTGILRSWNDDRGFGFIAPTQGGREVFVHIRAFGNDGTRPTVGERLSYEIGPGKDGKPQALRVVRTAVGPDAPRRQPPPPRATPRRSWLGALALLACLGVGGLVAYKVLAKSWHRAELAAQPARPAAPAPAPGQLPGRSSDLGAFRCDGRTRCSQMTSCAEATWFINHCPGTTMDSDGDGIPCEQQWCSP